MGLTSSMKSINTKRVGQSGAVSLFVVVFAMLIITVITLSFLRLMVADQNQSTNANLAEGARNSAMAGVEDAKRALLDFKKCVGGVSSEVPSDCVDIEHRLSSDVCNYAIYGAGLVSSGSEQGGTETAPGEILVQQSEGDKDLDQAYTCVKLKLNTNDYIGSAAVHETRMIPLVGTSSFTKIKLEWFSIDDMQSVQNRGQVDVPTGTRKPLPSGGRTSDWPANRPSVLRAQLMQFGETFRLTDFDSASSDESNASTLLLYPSATGLESGETSFSRDTRGASRSSSTAPFGIWCNPTMPAGGYACSATINLPNPVGGDEDNRTAYLRLVPFYNSTHFRVTLLDNSSTIVQFKAVQPEIDSTGRANNVFKRVASRVDLYGDGFGYPNAAVDLRGSFCKDFSVTEDDFISGQCEP